ncbi:MAG: prepilin-type N-terminal cleavage/methylation domain-containing protein [Hungatella sp.]
MKRTAQRKLNDRGFTLIELLISVTMLAVLVVPFLDAFLIGTKTNGKAKSLLKAKTAAENIMEGIRGTDFEDLLLQFNYPIIPKNGLQGETDRFDLMALPEGTRLGDVTDAADRHMVVRELQRSADDSGAYIPVMKYTTEEGKISSSILSKDEGVTYQFRGQPCGRYYMGIENLDMEGSRFDALITMDANAYKTGGKSGYNDMEVANIARLDILRDAFFVQDAEYDLLQAEAFAKKSAEAAGAEGSTTSEVSAEEFLNGAFTRTITIDITKSGKIYKAVASYTYSCKGETVGNAFGTTYTSKPDRRVFFDSSESNAELRSVYLCYVPLPGSGMGRGCTDRIFIQNPHSIPLDFYLIAQRQIGTGVGDEALETAGALPDSGYRAEVSLTEKPSEAGWQNHPASYRTKLKFRSNLGNTMENRNQLHLVCRDPSSSGADVKGSHAKKMMSFRGLDGCEAKNRLYDVNVTIYRHQKDDAFRDEDKLLSMDGSKND